jgi:hypothetical protein
MMLIKCSVAISNELKKDLNTVSLWEWYWYIRLKVNSDTNNTDNKYIFILILYQDENVITWF